MTLDATTRAIVDEMSRAFPDIGRVSVEKARQGARALVANEQAEPVHEVRDDRFDGPAGPIGVRIYRPGPGVRPAVVFFHGGGWTICDLDSHDGACRALANGSGAVVVSVDYRLAPEHRFPAALEDAEAAVRWVAGAGGELGVDAGRVAVAGDSAGGNLAAAVCLALRERSGPPVVFQLLVYPVLDAGMDTSSYRDNAEGYFLTAQHLRWYWDQYVPDAAQRDDQLASPLRARDLSGLPPAHIVTAEHDPLRDEGEAYANRLRDAGVAVTNVRYGGAFHGFFSLGAFLPAAAQATATAYAAVRAALESELLTA